ncbi:hypothetical protein IGK38_000704 [Enterococcus pernyi]
MNKKSLLFSVGLLGCLFGGGTDVFAADAADTMPDISNRQVSVGYYHNWVPEQGAGYQGGRPADTDLAKVNLFYNVIAVSFMKGEGIPTFKPYNMSDTEFRQKVATLNAANRVVIISLGGADSHIELHKGEEQAFADEIIRLVEVYGFDGLDIDLEQTNLAGTATHSTVALSWTKSTDDRGVAGYYIYRDGEQIGRATNNAYTDTKLTASTEYTYTVKAFDAAGNVSEESKALVISTLEEPPADLEAPSVPLNITASSISDKSVSLSWTQSTDNVGVVGYYVYRDGEQVGETETNTFSDAGLTANTEYSYTVKAFDKAGNISEESKALVVTTADAPSAEAWDADTIYDLGDIVTHKGNTYRAKWWTRGNEPGTEQWGPWELIG